MGESRSWTVDRCRRRRQADRELEVSAEEAASACAVRLELHDDRRDHRAGGGDARGDGRRHDVLEETAGDTS